MSIQFTSTKNQGEFSDTRLDPRVRMLAMYAHSYCMYRFGEPLYVNSVHRPEDTTSVHGHWRGVDADNDKGLSVSKKRELETHMNWLFCYDPERPELKVCLYHEVRGRGGDHLHFQVSENTKLNGGK